MMGSCNEEETHSNTARVFPSDKPVDNCARSSDQPEIINPGEQGPGAEHSLWTNDSPNDTGVVESCSSWACKALGLVLGAELWDITN
jgi:hypothetical protein